MLRPLMLSLLLAFPALAADPVPPAVEAVPIPAPLAVEHHQATSGIPVRFKAAGCTWALGSETMPPMFDAVGDTVTIVAMSGTVIGVAISKSGVSQRHVITFGPPQPLPPPTPVPPTPTPPAPTPPWPPVDPIKTKLADAFALDVGVDLAKRADAKALSAICAGAAMLANDFTEPTPGKRKYTVETADVLIKTISERAKGKVAGLAFTKAAIVKELAATLKDPKAALTDDSRKAVATLFTAAAGALEELGK